MAKYQEDFPEQVRQLCAEGGCTITDLARALGVKSRRTIYNWMDQYPEFLRAVTEGTDIAVLKVENSLFKLATGFTYTNTKEITEIEEVPYADVEKPAKRITTIKKHKELHHVPPDERAVEFFLSNREGAKWQRRTDVTSGGKPLQPGLDLTQFTDEELQKMREIHEAAQSRCNQGGAGQAEPR